MVKKSEDREAIRAFRQYARLGLGASPSRIGGSRSGFGGSRSKIDNSNSGVSELHSKIGDSSPQIGNFRSKCGTARLSVAEKYLLIEALCPTERSRLDLLAAHDTLRLLELNGEREVLEAVEAIYFGRSDETARVWRFAREHFCDVRTVYRRLERARRLFWAVRERERNS